MEKSLRVMALLVSLTLTSTTDGASPLSPQETRDIAQDAYVYAYPLVVMHISKKVATNVETPEFPHAPINQVAHAKGFPDPSMDIIASPNADTLYSSMNYDVSKEPLIVTAPASGGRYYLLPFIDAWTDIFTVPGSRTTGNDAQTICHRRSHLEG